MIVAAASVSPVTGEQVERLLEEGAAERCLLSPAQAAFGGLEAPAAQAEAILRRGSDLILQVDASPQARESSAAAARKAGVSQGEMGARIAAALSRLAGELLSQGLSKGVVLTGGDMAQAVLEYFGSGGMELWGEVEPGIPAGRLLGGGCLAVTKAGAFGTPQALCAARRWLKGKP